ncbi:retropepsin-like domain-containing protein [Niabella pedocola]|uniref:Retropepsin-like domain-containing protein n=1 Tax=Niabella pedocola TaxID=1752077 RepID=A0ABS8PW55_9BACT|nr:retropepsin-like aspartic protease [Niabella pedocola]MCD2425302.1 retropepsin-like domain-containing protein [Niabella pedocola]
MKHFLLRGIVFLVVGIPVFCRAQMENTSFKMICSAIGQKDFFKARTLYNADQRQLSVVQQQFIEAVLSNAFNRPQASNQKIGPLLKAGGGLPDSLQLRLYRIREDNYVKLHQYKAAKTAVQELLNRYGTILKEEEKSDLENNLKLWTALEPVPPQRVQLRSSRIKMEKDKAGLNNLDMITESDTLSCIFDTGANLSTITRSAAQSLKLEVIPAGIDVGALTGNTVKADLGVCKKMRIGNNIIEEVVFLVLPDEALAFPQIGYQIHGILGFPVIEALREVQVTQDGYFIVPEKETDIHTASNMAIDGLSPLIQIDGRHFTFDTGADHTILYRSFFLEQQPQLIRSWKPVKIGLGGAGGKKEYEGYKISHTFSILGRNVQLDSISLLKEPVSNETVYGNIGQDLIRKFKKMTLNFDRMFIKFD